MPVLPLVESSKIFPELSLPECSASRMMFAAARSLTEPPGLYHSALARNVTCGRCSLTRSRRSKGVFPTRSSARCPKCNAGSCVPREVAFWLRPSLDEGDAMPSQKYRDYSNVPDSTKRGIYYLLLIHDYGVSIHATFA